MGLGVLEDRKLEHVPGTAIVNDNEQRRHEQHAALDPNLKYDRSGKIILVPQPSNDPNDPLNWPLWRRDLILFILSLLSVIAATLSPLLAANTVSVALYFGRTFTDIALLTGYHLLGVAIAGLLFVPSARVWGKRHAYIIGTIFLIFSSAWAGASNCGIKGTCQGKPEGHARYVSLLWARIFQGVGLAPFEALVNASVGDLYFVHERGKRMALSNLALFGGAFFTPVIVGKMTSTMGWPWTFYFVAIFAGLLLPVVILFVPETAYRRADHFNTDTSTTNQTQTSGGHELNGKLVSATGAETSPQDSAEHDRTGNEEYYASTNPTKPQNSIDTDHQTLHNPSNGVQPRRTTWTQSLMPFNGRKTDDNFFLLLLRPFPLFLHPGVFWACLIQGTMIGWTVMIGIVLAAIMLGPPLFFTEVETGYMYTGAFVGALLGFILAGLLSDSVPAYLTRLNKGVFEPEFRLVLVIPQLIFGCAGLYGFGITSNNTTRYGWFWPDFFFALEVMGMVLGAVASALYIVDAHRDIAVEAFTCLLVFKNIFSFGLTWSGYNWLVKHGIERPFNIIGSVQLVICLLSVFMYVFGKRNRSFWALHPVLLLKTR